MESNWLWNFMQISVSKLNLFSMVIGVIIGLCARPFDRHKTWLYIITYFVLVVLYFAYVSGNLSSFFR